jgi:hypothetical protein
MSEMGRSKADIRRQSIIRIKSAHKWPEPIVIDTSLPTIVPPLPVLAKVSSINQPREAFAQLNSPLPKYQNIPGRLEQSARSLHKPDRREWRLIEQQCAAPDRLRACREKFR